VGRELFDLVAGPVEDARDADPVRDPEDRVDFRAAVFDSRRTPEHRRSDSPADRRAEKETDAGEPALAEVPKRRDSGAGHHPDHPPHRIDDVLVLRGREDAVLQPARRGDDVLEGAPYLLLDNRVRDMSVRVGERGDYDAFREYVFWDRAG